MTQRKRSTSREIAGIRLPARMKADRLKPSINRAFINTSVPEVKPTPAQETEWRTQLGIAPTASGDGVGCVYCGRSATQFDHFRNLTDGGRPSGYITDIFNLVPCCSPCNNSKRGEDWRTWMMSGAPGSPRQRLNPSDLAARMAVLDRFDAWSEPRATRLGVLAIVGQDEWKKCEADIEAAIKLLQSVRQRSDRFHTLIWQAYTEEVARKAGDASSELGPTTPHYPPAQ